MEIHNLKTSSSFRSRLARSRSKSVDLNDDGSTQSQYQYWKSIKVSGKMIEAKYLNWDKSDGPCDVYMVARLDNRADTEIRTAVIDNTTSPFWAEDFQFQGVRGYHDLKFVIYGPSSSNSSSVDKKAKQVVTESIDKPLGKVMFPRSILKGEVEEWYCLENADYENSVSGDVRLKIKYFPAKGDSKYHGIAVTPVCARNLVQSKPDKPPSPFLAFHILPDKDATSTQQTLVQPKTVNPVYGETFFFTLTLPELKDRALHCSVWDNVTTEDTESFDFLGHVSIPLNPILKCAAVDKWYSLQPSAPPSTQEKRSRSSRKRSIVDDDRKLRPRDFVRSLHAQLPSSGGPAIRKSHLFVDQGFAFQTCSHCNGVMIGNQLACTSCNIYLHSKCKEIASPFCGDYGVVKLRTKVVEHTVLPLQLYVNFLQLVEENDFRLAFLLGRVSQDREEAARNFLNIFETKFSELEFLKCVARLEIELATEPTTLFRANSMASKAIDVYMKQVASNHLKEVLEPRLQDLVASGSYCEIDPSKLDKSEKVDIVIPRNVGNLYVYSNKIIEAIFAMVDEFPMILRQLFSYIQSLVIAKFPDDSEARYTCVSGFVFLRFFAPAILGPKLFGLSVGIIDAKSSRALVLIAKILQNLSNLVEFGQKEAFMAPMNMFILENVSGMKSYIDRLCDVPKENRTRGKQKGEVWSYLASEDPVTAATVARESAELISIFSLALDKMNALEPHDALLKALDDAIQSIHLIQQGLKKNEDNVVNDFGADVERHDDLMVRKTYAGEAVTPKSHVIRDDLNEYRIANYLGLCASPTKGQSSLKTASELKDTMQRVAIQRKCDIVMSPITPVTPISPSLPSVVPTSDRLMTEIFKQVQLDENRDSNGSHGNVAKTTTQAGDGNNLGSTPTGASQSDSSLALSQTLTSSFSGGVSGVTPSPSITVTDYNIQRIPSSKNAAHRLTSLKRSESSSSLQGRGLGRQHSRPKPSAIGLSGKSNFDINASTGALGSSSQAQLQESPATSPTISPSTTGIPAVLAKTRVSRIAASERPDPVSKDKDPSSGSSRLGNALSGLGGKLRSSFHGLVEGRSSTAIHSSNESAEIEFCKCPQFDPDDDKREDDKEDDFVDLMTMLSSPTPSVVTSPVGSSAPSRAFSKKEKATSVCSRCDKPKQDAVEDTQTIAGSSNPPRVSVSQTSSSITSRWRHRRDPSKSDAHVLPDVSSLPPIPTSSLTASTVCHRCEIPFGENNVYEINGMRYHAECMTCRACGDGLSNEAIVHDGDVVCKGCYLSALGMQCAGCGLFIEAKYLALNGKKYHISCKRCCRCDAEISSREYFSIGDYLFCTDHKDTLITCTFCNRKIDGHVLIARSPPRFYHPNHFSCGGCKKNLSETLFYEHEGASLCQPCFLEKTEDSSDTQVHVGGPSVTGAMAINTSESFGDFATKFGTTLANNSHLASSKEFTSLSLGRRDRSETLESAKQWVLDVESKLDFAI